MQIAVCTVPDFQTSFPPDLAGPAPKFLHDWYQQKGLLPDNPAGFPAREEGGVRPIRVLIESRQGPVRNLINVDELVHKCNDLGGPWACRSYKTGSNFAR